MEKTKIVIALSHRQDMQKDVDALVCRMVGVGKRSPMVDRLKEVIGAETKVINFINSDEVCLDTGGASCLESFKEYERLWASRKNEGTPEKDWYKMQDELAEYIEKLKIKNQ